MSRPDDLAAVYGQVATDRTGASLCAGLRAAAVDARLEGDAICVRVRGARLYLRRKAEGLYLVAGEAADEGLLREAARWLSNALRGLSLNHRLEVFTADGRETAAYHLGWPGPDDAPEAAESPDLTFEAWVRYVFDRPGEGPEWYRDHELDWWTGTPLQIAEYMARLFEGAGTLLAPYTDAQAYRGLYYVASNGLSDYMFALLDDSVPWPLRRRAIRAMVTLYVDCFAPRCTNSLGHRDERGATPLNGICYMWFDVIPICTINGGPEPGGIDAEMLDAMRRILTIPSEACQEGALHGLGHWHLGYPRIVEGTVDAFLRANPTLRKELRQYALSARKGCVL